MMCHRWNFDEFFFLSRPSTNTEPTENFGLGVEFFYCQSWPQILWKFHATTGSCHFKMTHTHYIRKPYTNAENIQTKKQTHSLSLKQNSINFMRWVWSFFFSNTRRFACRSFHFVPLKSFSTFCGDIFGKNFPTSSAYFIYLKCIIIMDENRVALSR